MKKVDLDCVYAILNFLIPGITVGVKEMNIFRSRSFWFVYEPVYRSLLRHFSEFLVKWDIQCLDEMKGKACRGIQFVIVREEKELCRK